ncbi:hypothetical protein [Rhodococcus tukisamuensis]|uniref:Uncharacterized protein n=1 Tax=Rhodococcus tukisamuensis TaxID=168276 RepID=A0A1G6RFC8_9NOCA|nr:hypothetical protein [Rhodococcus tukisamuensis]SDD02727.1 hypothetical protein SAMN05444580_102434 [Rhodococcus tukisamuensis]
MFRTLAQLLNPLPQPAGLTHADTVFAFHPEQSSRWLDEIWRSGGIASWANVLLPQAVPLGDPSAITRTQLPPGPLMTASGVNVAAPGGPLPLPLPPGYNLPPLGTVGPPLLWQHLMYAYLVESTGVFEILAEVARRYAVGETLPTPRLDTVVWLRATEELFFRDPPLFRVGGLTSQLRPDARVNRRNAYWRMFGLDLPHAAGARIEGQPWKRDAGTTSNTRFLELWNELLRQVWLGIENVTNSSGPKPTDDSYIAYLAQTIGEMLRLRRRGGMLSREEFSYVCMLSWFHLTVEFDNSVVLDLHATAGAGGNAADRLAAIGERVGIAPSRQARELFELADLVSPLLWALELRIFDPPLAAPLLYNVNVSLAARLMNRIIDLWQSATGERVKDLAVTMRRGAAPARSAQPVTLPREFVPTAPRPSSTNGKPVGTRS